MKGSTVVLRHPGEGLAAEVVDGAGPGGFFKRAGF